MRVFVVKFLFLQFLFLTALFAIASIFQNKLGIDASWLDLVASGIVSSILYQVFLMYALFASISAWVANFFFISNRRRQSVVVVGTFCLHAVCSVYLLPNFSVKNFLLVPLGALAVYMAFQLSLSFPGNREPVE